MTKAKEVPMPEVSMREQLTTLVTEMKADGFDFNQTPPVFEWRYEAIPTMLFKLLIVEEPIVVPTDEVVH